MNYVWSDSLTRGQCLECSVYLMHWRNGSVIDRVWGYPLACTYRTDSGGLSRTRNRWSPSCGRRSVDQFVFDIEPPLGTHDQTFSSFFSFDNNVLLVPRAPSLTRGRVCSLQCMVSSLMTKNHTLQSHLRLFPFCRLLRLAGTTVEVF
jgi:hypothetical protein